MTPLRFLVCLLAVFFTLSGSDYLIHQKIMAADYAATLALWRSHETMQNFMSWIFVAEIILASALTLLWVKTAAEKACWKCALGFGVCCGIIGSCYALFFYAVMPIPGAMAAKWMVFGVLQTVLITAVLFVFTKRSRPQGVAS